MFVLPTDIPDTVSETKSWDFVVLVAVPPCSPMVVTFMSSDPAIVFLPQPDASVLPTTPAINVTVFAGLDGKVTHVSKEVVLSLVTYGAKGQLLSLMRISVYVYGRFQRPRPHTTLPSSFVSTTYESSPFPLLLA
jgi:hypothetical protein